MSQDDDWLIDDSEEAAEQDAAGAWHVLIVDDEPDIHRVTQLALSGIDFLGRPLKLHSCYSGKEALEFLSKTPDIALILLDVVMESEDAGLKTARAIREQLGNRQVRIILRTGQPGVAPERQVIESYDINDYKAKTELTRDKLYTAVLGTLRSYNDIMLIEQQRQMLDANRRGLLKVIEASRAIFQQPSIEELAQGVLEQLQSLLFFEQDALYVVVNGGVAALSDHDAVRVLYATGGYSELRGKTLPEADLARFRPSIDEAIEKAHSTYADDHFVGFFKTPHGPVNLFIIEGPVSLSHGDRDLIEMFCSNVSIAYENLLMTREIEETQRAIIYQLSEVVEYRSQDTGHHIRRMAEYSYLIARAMGLDEEEASIIRTAAPLHDIGKVGIPDAVLLKPGPLTADERVIMNRHAEIGYDMLKGARQRILKMAATIAHTHHEKWNGTGYPRGLKGEDIHIAGRITALADVYDALANKRCYKEAWPTDEVLDEIRRLRGTHLDPGVVDTFFNILHEIEAVRMLYRDGT
ncbi:Response regulator receiver domain-containing protein [Andreprevotia lacus DSM 23236]|jgi:response regulator RpfG family c-di-GMP phosphodiesterase|uniref:Response regulator receiver domain-containing protein n=1 Tax=Andreprevotia lacus DSM 23236 TaxID=1121001 RepID=A0A1W1XVW2_9NEIS|nr:response regulator [Andreprevotia lacus]SMC28073.1 Response regulator receiver domain-containing protein [Andreprevotia lacus DSM 23236]